MKPTLSRLYASFLSDMLFNHGDVSDNFLQNVGWLSNRLHDVIPHYIELFIATAVRTLHLT
jgi:hypothetical protein